MVYLINNYDEKVFCFYLHLNNLLIIYENAYDKWGSSSICMVNWDAELLFGSFCFYVMS